MHGIVLVHTTSAAIRCERVLLQAGLSIKLIPTPRQFSSDCGMAVRFPWEQAELVRTLLAAARVEISSIRLLQ